MTKKVRTLWNNQISFSSFFVEKLQMAWTIWFLQPATNTPSPQANKDDIHYIEANNHDSHWNQFAKHL